MSHPEAWREVVGVLGRYSPLTFWRTSESGSTEFWWAISAADDDVREDRVVGFLNPDDPLYYHSINSAVVFREHPGTPEEPFPADRWERLKHELSRVQGLRVVAVRDVEVSGAATRNEALDLTMMSVAAGEGAA